MPEKDGSEDKKSTKSVVNKKQKQFMNQEEQLDLSSVAESFGGKIVGEPVELDEGVISIPTAALIAKYGLPLAMTAIGGVGTYLQSRRRKRYNDQDIGGPTGGTKDRTINTKDLTPELEKRRKELDKNTLNRTVSNFFNRFKKNKNNNNQSNKNKNNKFSKRDSAIGFGSGLGTSTAVSTLTKKKTGGGGFRLGGLPGTSHNVGRRTNPQ